MGVKRNLQNVSYGLSQALIQESPTPIVSRRNPTASDSGELGQLWVNKAINAYFVLTSVAAGAATWAAQATGGGTFASVDITGDTGDVLTVATGGDSVLGGDLSVAGDSDIAGSLTVEGTATFNGDFALDSADQISITSSYAGAGAIALNASDAAGTLSLHGEGGVSLFSTDAFLSLTSGTGTLSISADAAATTVNVATGAAVKIATLGSVTGASATTVRSGTGGLNVTATNGALAIASGTGAMNISADAAATTVHVGTGAAVKTVVLGSTTAGSTTAIATPTGTNVVAANGVSVTTAGRGVSLPGGLLVLAGAGSPSGAVTAPIGSLFLRSDPAGATSRLYVNTDAGTTWTNVTCAA